jgi:hypothetical protein
VPAQLAFFIQFLHHLRLPAHAINFFHIFFSNNSTSVKILQFCKCQNFTILQVSKVYVKLWSFAQPQSKCPLLFYTLAGFDLTTHNFTGRDEKPRSQNQTLSFWQPWKLHFLCLYII